MAKRLIQALFGTKQEHDLKQLTPIIHTINELEGWALSLQDEQFPQVTLELKNELAQGASLDDLLPRAFALAREAGRRRLGERMYDVQLTGAVVLHQGKIMEMKTGEGKTLSCVPAAYLNALAGKGVHIVTVNDYLAERDAQWMSNVYTFLGLSVGVILSDLSTEERKEAYSKDITYGTNNEFGFDYLRDNMKWDSRDKIQPVHSYCIIDEIDSILIDEARTPLIISGSADDDTKKFFDVNQIVSSLKECQKDPESGEYPENPIGDYQIDEKTKRVTFTNEGNDSIERLLQSRNVISGSLFNDENFEYIHYVTQAVKAHRLFAKDVDYVVKDGQVQIVDEFTGRILYGRRYSDGLHQAIEAKERIKIARRNRTLATVTFQNFFRMYDKISGMTGTADTEAAEFAKIYGLDVVVIPTNRPVARKDEHDLIYFNEEFKYQAICEEIEQCHRKGQPILVGTVSIEKSELLASYLTKRGIRHEVLNAKNHAREALIIAEAGSLGAVTIATNMAGRGTDIKLGGNPEYRARKKCPTDADQTTYLKLLEKEYRVWKEEYEKVKQLGGLYIIGTERHDSRRIDNQLRGRSGRQGDPGRSRFYLSLEDSLMRLFARDNLKSLMGRIGMADGEPIYHSMISGAIEKAQSKVEERNFDIRKHLLEYDDVLNEQRNFIYQQRDSILLDTALLERILLAAKEMVDDIVTGEIESSKQSSLILEGIKARLFKTFGLELELSGQSTGAKESHRITDHVMGIIEEQMRDKAQKIGQEKFNEFMRFQYLKQIDTKWQDHLEQLEALREAVYLRSYAQKNPLLEYKLEGFDIFDTMLQTIKYDIARMAVRIQIREKASPVKGRPVANTSAVHSGLTQFGAAASSSGTLADGKQIQVKRSQEKVGRNDPCPCGSGKKYKHCCGA